MKTVYAEIHGRPQKLIVKQEIEEKIHQSRLKIMELIREDIGIPTFEIPVEGGDFGDSHYCKELKALTRWDDGESDNHTTRALRIMLNREPRGFVHTDLGHYCHEGWDSAIENRDLNDISSLHFTEMFLFYLRKPNESTNPWKIVAEEHQRLLIPKLYRKILLEMRRYGESSCLKDVSLLCRQIWKGQASFSELEETYHSAFWSQSRGKERL